MLSSYFKNARLELSYKSFRMKNTGGSALENELKNVYIDQVLPFVETFFFLFHIGMLLRRLNVYTVVERFARGHVTMTTATY